MMDLQSVEAALAQYPSNLPRYTSYPPANHFSLQGGAAQRDAFVAAVQNADSLSAYIHVPFCDRLCWFCGCHTKQTLKYEPVRAFAKTLVKEIGLWRENLAARKVLSRLHLGGGSPSMLKEDDLVLIRRRLDEAFQIRPETEISIEIDPSDMTAASVEAMQRFGLTRASIGVQDFDPAVQSAINRPQTYETTRHVVEALRGVGVKSINIDALYGLPLQTEARLRRTLQQILQLKPDRIALFGYAHVPWMKSHQNLIDERDLPSGSERLHHAMLARDLICKAGYVPIGIDHFALPHDAIAKAAATGRLRRNFQGYTDDDAQVLLPLGPSSIGQYSEGFVQNEVATARYAARIERGDFAFARGHRLTSADKAEAWLIERLMCDFGFTFEQFRSKFGPESGRAISLARFLAAQDRTRTIEIQNHHFRIKPEAWPLTRAIASQFDSRLKDSEMKYSKAV
jgi:oxygen-independent coproporphyrinogen III oxidase